MRASNTLHSLSKTDTILWRVFAITLVASLQQPSTLNPMVDRDRTNPSNCVSDMPTDTVWRPPLSERSFNMIQAFCVEIVLPSSSPWYSSNPNAADGQIVKSRLPDYCDHLHRLIGRLRLMQTPIARLEIIIKFYDINVSQADAFSAAQILMQPFRRLRNVARPSLRSISIRGHLGEVALLTPGWAVSAVGNEFYVYLTDLFQCMLE